MNTAYIFYGKSGSGKGTQAAELKTYLESNGRNVLYIETGNLFRSFIENQKSFAADRTREIIESGKLMPPFFPIYIWAHELIQHFTGNQDVIFDGVARRIEEATILDSALEFFKFDRVFVLHIHVSDQSAIDRLSVRAQGRADDADVEKIKSRLSWYGENVVPAIEYWQNHPHFTFLEINGEERVSGVWEELKQKIEK